MKKRQLLFVFMLLGAIVANAQQKIIITGVMYDPKGNDAETPGTTSGYPSGAPAKGGFEYIQFLATEDIDFSVTPYSVITCVNPGAVPPTAGWATGGAKTYKFNLTSGTAAKGTYFYVGGPEKCIAGYWSSTRTADISSSNWIKTIAYSGTTGDDGIGNATTGLMANNGNPVGVAVFEGTAVTEVSVPMDAVFWGTTTTMTSSAVNGTYSAGPPILGYRVPLATQNNDLYQATVASPFLAVAPNKKQLLGQENTTLTAAEVTGTLAADNTKTTDKSRFLILGGVYDDVNGVWLTTRTASYKHKCLYWDYDSSGTITAADAAYPQLSDIEGADATKLSTTLPIVLINFAAKSNGSTVKLNWATAQEKSNAYFAVLRSTDGKTFVQIGTVGGNGNSQTAHNYNYTDNNPAAGTSYYQLKQVDNDGKFTLSNIVAAGSELANSALKASSKNGIVSVAFNNATTAKTAQITFGDMAGKKVGTYKQEVGAGSNTLSFATPLQPGVYVLTLQLGTTQTATKILVN